MDQPLIQTAAVPGGAFLESVARLGGGRVLLIGDLMLDETIRGGAERLSPDAPVPVLSVDDEPGSHLREPGGTGNVAACLRALDTEVEVVGLLGADEPGRYLREVLAARGCGVDGLVEDPGRPTTVKRSLVGLAQHRHPQKMFRLDIETRREADEPQVRAMLAAIDARIDQVDVVCIEDYAKGTCTEALCQGVVSRCRDRGIPLLVDPAAIDDYTRYAGATAITPNRKETALASGLQDAGPVDLQQAATMGVAMRETHGFDQVVLTLDRDGALLVEADGVRHLPTEARSVYDVTGAGDMVLAGMAAGLASGFDWLDAVRTANLAGGLEVERFGAQPVPLPEVKREALRLFGGLSGKVRSLDQLLLELEVMRADGRRIVLTNGCFDVIHAGHVAYLKEARQQGDVLVVGVNADAQVRALKGEDRPIFNEVERLEILEELASVDYLVLFEEPTAEELISALLPDVYVKGGDYAPHEIAEHELLASRNIEIRVLALRPGLGSSSIIERIRSVDGR